MSLCPGIGDTVLLKFFNNFIRQRWTKFCDEFSINIVYAVFLPPPPSKSSPLLSTKAFFKDLAEMKPVDQEGNGLRKKAGTADHSPEQ